MYISRQASLSLSEPRAKMYTMFKRGNKIRVLHPQISSLSTSRPPLNFSPARESDWRWLGDLEDKADERGWLVVFDGVMAGGCVLRTLVLFSCAQIESVTEVGRQLLAFFLTGRTAHDGRTKQGERPGFFDVP
jgi:hypothetical protein